MHFSDRTDFGEEEDPLSEAALARRRAGLPVLDLTESNPTNCGLALPADKVLPALASEANRVYRAEPFGSITAREAIAKQYYGGKGIEVAPDHMVLTASTSESYSFLFRLLCEPGDHVLVPQPSYPLFDLLARLSDVETRTYPLRFHDRWETDLFALEAAITPRTRAIVVVHPNNPSGHFAGARERAALDNLAARHGLPLLIDEVFLDYPVEAGVGLSRASFASASEHKALTFVMSGLSKVLALPQMKLAWTVVFGPEALCEKALHRLEFIADTFLSVAAPGANAVPSWLGVANDVQTLVLARVQSNLATLDAALWSCPTVSRLPVEGGWCVLLRVPALEPDLEFALRLLHEKGTLVHPGSFFGLPERGWVVLSLLVSPESFRAALQSLLALVQKMVDEVLHFVPENLSSNA